MAYVRLILTANALKRLQKELLEEKQEAYKSSQGEATKRRFKLNHIGTYIEDGVKSCCRKIFSLPEESCLHKTCYRLQHDGSCENYVLKSFFGFFGGILLTYILFMFFVFQLNLRLTTATVFCSFLGCFLTVGLAFSTKVRCIVLLTLPQFFSKKGRQALLAYGFILALTGPAQNTLNNLGILSESLACGQEQLKQAVLQIIEVIKKPFLAIKEAIKKVVKTVKEVVKMIKEVFLKIKRIIMAIVKIIKAAFEFLGKIINICNKELGTPFQRCSRIFENAILDCNAKLGPLFSWMCSLTYIVKAVCYIVKIFDYVCMLVDFFTDSVIGVVIRKVKSFIRHVKTMFYVRIKFGHSYKQKTTASKSLKEISKEIAAEIKERSKGIVAFFTFMTSAAMLFFIFIVFQVAYYRIKYLTSERFDNIYITKHFRQIDMRRAKLEKETVLPLNKREEKIYVPISSGKLAKIERKSLAKSMTTLGTATVKLGTHMIFDYCLYWILDLISYHARYQSKAQMPSLPKAHVTGEGLLAKLLRAIVKAFQPVGIELEIDTVPCLPIPIPPNYDRFIQIGIVIVICWILTLLEPYGLRFRSYIMGYYHPVRAKQRTIWLYNHILRSRVSFLDLARRALKRKFGHKGVDKITCKEYLQSHLRCGIFRICLGSDLQVACMICGEIFREGDAKKPIRCSTPGCPGVFCKECFADLDNICPICFNPIEYGEVEDEEKDSSGDESPPKKPPKRRRRCKWFPCTKTTDDDKDILTSSGENLAQNETQDHIESEESEAEVSKPQDVDLSDSSTDYSYAYQDDEPQKQVYPETLLIHKDLEKQAVPDFESMQSFREEEIEKQAHHQDLRKMQRYSENEKKNKVKDDQVNEPFLIELDIDNALNIPEGHRARVELSVSSEVTDTDLEDEKEVETVSLLGRYGSEKSKHVEFVGVPEELCDCQEKDYQESGSQSYLHYHSRKRIKSIAASSTSLECHCTEETSFITLPKSTMFTSTRSDCQCCHLPIIEAISSFSLDSETKKEIDNIVPLLDLSFVNNSKNSSHQSNSSRILSDIFQDRVKYNVVCETPSSSPRTQSSLQSSSILSDLQNPPIYTYQNERKRNAKTQYRKQEEYRRCPRSPQNDNFDKKQSRKISKYYKSTNEYPKIKCEKPKKKNVGDLFRKILPKRYTREVELPLYHHPCKDEFEIQSYNYCQRNWESLETPLNPFDDQCSCETAQLLPRRVKDSRLRGGQSLHSIDCSRAQGRVSKNLSGDSRTLKRLLSQPLQVKPHPLTTNELLSRYFTSIEDLTPTHDPGLQMSHRDSPKNIVFSGTEKESTTNLTDRTVSSSDSCLSEATCFALFGGPCPAGLRQKLDKRVSTEIPFLEEIDTKASSTRLQSQESIYSNALSNLEGGREIIEKSSTQSKISNEKILPVPVDSRRTVDLDNLPEKLPSSLQKSDDSLSKNQKISVQELNPFKKESKESPENNSRQSSESLSKQKSIEKLITINTTQRTSAQELSQLKKDSKQSPQSFSLQTGEVSSAEKTISTENPQKISVQFTKASTESLKRGSKLSLTSKQKSPTQLFEQLERIKEHPEEQSFDNSSQPQRPRSQLNQLLYKDDKTEICLVQNFGLNDRQVTESCPIQSSRHNIIQPPKSFSAPIIKSGQAPALKLQLNLHNSLISDDQVKDTQNEIEMDSPKSKDKIVETREVFPLRKDWTRDSTSSSRIILASDKQQQTSDNDFYHASNNTVRFSSKDSSLSTYEYRKCKCSTSSEDKSMLSNERHSTASHFDDAPERDFNEARRKCECIYPLEKHLQRHFVDQETSTDSSAANVIEECNCCKCRKNESRNKPLFDYRTRPQTPPREYRTEYRNINFPSTSSDFSIPTKSNYPDFMPPPPPRPPCTRIHSPRMEKIPRIHRTPRDVPGRMEWPMEPPIERRSKAPHKEKCYEQCRCCYNNSRVPSPPPNVSYRDANNYQMYSDEDDFDEPHSNTSLTDLPYQDNEQYMDLVQELQDTLHTRNRNRVRRAMQEFEQKSKHNQPLEKPIINYDEASESEEPIIRKLNELTTGKVERKLCCAEDKCACRDKNLVKKKKVKKERARRKMDVSPDRPRRWAMDTNSGEWYRACRCPKPQRGDPEYRDYDDQYFCNCNCERRMQ